MTHSLFFLACEAFIKGRGRARDETVLLLCPGTMPFMSETSITFEFSTWQFYDTCMWGQMPEKQHVRVSGQALWQAELLS